MGIMDLFRTAVPIQQLVPVAPNPNQQNPGLPPVPGAPVATANFFQAPAAPAQETKPEPTPEDKFKDFWTPPEAPKDEPVFNPIDPKTLAEAAAKIDFTKSITPEDLAAIQKGGPEAVAALMKSLNSVAQQGYSNNAIAATKISEAAVKQAEARFKKQLPGIMKELSSRDSMAEQNPLMTSPLAQPLVEAARKMFIDRNPNATPKEINTNVTDYFDALSQVTRKQAPEVKGAKKNQDVDWSELVPD